jgi:hypothetical protein
MRARRSFVVLVLALLVSACSDVPSDETPRGALRLFLSAMDRSDRDPDALRDAYALLSASTRRALAQRAHDAETLGADGLEPWEMLVRGGYRQTFTPARGARGLREHVDGDQARVVVTSEDGTRHAEVPLVREHGRWRVVIAIPSARGT